MRVFFFVGVFLFTVSFTVAQEYDAVEKLLEVHDVEPSDGQYEDVLSVLQRLREFPLNLNTADFDSLKLLFFLSDSQIDNILAFRRKSGGFLSLDELLLVPSISKKDLASIRLFVCTEGEEVPQQVKRNRSGVRQEVIDRGRMTFPRQEGYRYYSPKDFKTETLYLRKMRSRFQGAPLGSLVKYRAEVGSHFQFGMTLENDPGEAYFTRNQKMGFDFCSMYASVSAGRWMKRLVVGDYKVQWGQGLVAWGGFASGKSSVVLGNEKSARGVLPYSSTDENNYLRGVALTLQPLSSVTTEFFVSYKRTDGNVVEADSLLDEEEVTASLYESGYHRSENECAKKHTLKEFTTGVAVGVNTSFFKAGIHALYYDFSPGLQVGEKVYQRYNDDGQRRGVVGVDYKTGFRSVYLFGETALCERGELATVNGLRFSGSSRMALSVLYRRYAKGYVSRYASGFGEYSGTSNEEGVYVGMDLNLAKRVKMSVYYDHFRFFSARYDSSVPASGDEVLASVTYERRRCEHSIRMKYEERPEDWKGIRVTTTWRKRLELRYQLGYKCDERFALRTRLNWLHYLRAGKREHGYLIYQDFIYGNRNGSLKMQCRVAYFDTDSYNSRIYSYEHHVLYGYSFPACYGRGVRTYLNLNWKVTKRLTLYAKSGLSYYPERSTLGSYVTLVNDNKLIDVTLQVRWRF
ncbi:ComEA family DNA-binding protein [Odoribacter lunatus]|uniref:ComEA family DNA-binding protein n=1 Tax=Odoribacter lunatus TaxID=2941335 RepID=UPI00203C368B|nr:helix-hairpin-helix domain-containing protein [Odoribacter lunatus]